jgi:hypothetical protein
LVNEQIRKCTFGNLEGSVKKAKGMHDITIMPLFLKGPKALAEY